jgi:DNA recombination protein RmuC
VEISAERDRDRAELLHLREELSTAREARAEADARLAESAKFHEDKLALLGEAQQTLTDTFHALSAEALRQNNQSFLDLARTHLETFQQGAQRDLDARAKVVDELVRPVREALAGVECSLKELEMSRVEAYSGLTEQVRSLLETQSQLRLETAALVNALRTPAVRGRWGEVQLRRVVELAGMVQHCDFDVQPIVATDDGTLRPDMLIHLPSQRSIVVDAKVPLKAYLESLDAPNETLRIARLRDHAQQLRAHLNQLANKRYWNQFTDAPEFAVAFLPAEPIFAAALEQDPSLIEFGAEQGVILATPTTLIALLKAVAYGWQQQRLAENARQISEVGQTLYERILVFTEHVEDIRKNLHRTVESYNRAAGSLESRVLVSARRLKELGAASGAVIKVVEPVEYLPRDLRSLEEAASLPVQEPEQLSFESELAGNQCCPSGSEPEGPPPAMAASRLSP